MRRQIPLAVAGTAASLIIIASAGGIAVLTKAEPGLSQTGKAIWYCTYILDNRETTMILETACPSSIRM